MEDAKALLPLTIPMSMSLFAFDFSGSGKSSGDYVTMGLRERFDVQSVVTHLEHFGVSRIVLWGFSMGASTAVMYAGLPSVSACVKALILDSPFSCVRDVIEHRARCMLGRLHCLKRIVSYVYRRLVRKEMLRRCGGRIEDMNALKSAGEVPVHLPALFVHGEDDDIVPMKQGLALFKAYAGEQKLWGKVPELGHTDVRPEEVDDLMSWFAVQSLIKDGPVSFPTEERAEDSPGCKQ